jgi:hypothetical protein
MNPHSAWTAHFPGPRRGTILRGVVRRGIVRMVVVVLLAFGFAGNAPAEEFLAPERNGGTRVDAIHRNISRRILSTAQWLDSFFDDERFESEENRSRMRISFENRLLDAEGLDSDVRTRLRIVLPELEERLAFEISGDTGDSFRNVPSREVEDPDESGLTAGFRYLIRGTDRFNLHLSTGLRIRDAAPVFYLEPRHRFTQDLEPWILRFTQRLRWYSDEGWEPRSRVDLERLIWGDFFFRSTAEVKWLEREPGVFYDLDASVSRVLDSVSAAELLWGNRFETRPRHRLERSFLQFRYRRRIWRDWLSFEIGPELAFPEDRDFHPSLGAFLNVHVVFGYAEP